MIHLTLGEPRNVPGRMGHGGKSATKAYVAVKVAKGFGSNKQSVFILKKQCVYIYMCVCRYIYICICTHLRICVKVHKK